MQLVRKQTERCIQFVSLNFRIHLSLIISEKKYPFNMIQQEVQKRELFKRNVLMTSTWQELSTEPTRQVDVGVYEHSSHMRKA